MEVTKSRVRTFVATFATSGQAELFLGEFIDKRGRLEGGNYICRRYGKCQDGNQWSAMIELEPDGQAQTSSHAVDFSRLLASAGAKEI
jgi:hypothetical protein